MNEHALSTLCRPWLKVDMDEYERPTISECSKDVEGELIIPEGIININYEAFKNCNKITDIILSESIEYIQQYAFEGCCLQMFNKFDGCKYLGTTENPYKFLIGPIWPDKISVCRIHPDCQVICDGAFERCCNLTNVLFNNKIREIGVWAFRCSWITEIQFPNTIKEIPAFCCEYCFNLHKVIIPESIQLIECSAFEGCKYLKEVEMPSTIQVEDNVFWGCESLYPNLTQSTGSKFIDLSI